MENKFAHAFYLNKFLTVCFFSLNVIKKKKKKNLTILFFLLWYVILLPLWKINFYKQISIE